MMRPNPANASTRPPAVAGLFYPDDPRQLGDAVAGYLAEARRAVNPQRPPKALIVPHAGYIYSAPVAARAYALLEPFRECFRRVVLIGPAHRVYLHGLAVPQASAFATPLGSIALDRIAMAALLDAGLAIESSAAHGLEHSLEVQLPFLQQVLGSFTLLPLVAGATSPAAVAEVLGRVASAADTLIVVSSDLSHYHSYAQAQQLDARTASAILERNTGLRGEQACGAVGINGLLLRAQELGFTVEELARLNSGDTAGDRERVVGYAAFALYESPESPRS